MMHYKDPDTGIEASVNVAACETQEQFDACQKFLMDLAGVPTEKEKEEWVKGYDKFKIILEALRNLDWEIHDYCKWVKKCGGPPRENFVIDMNIDGVSIEKHRELKYLLDVIDVVFK